jgi:ABC-2 type transport system ATP-binding protein
VELKDDATYEAIRDAVADLGLALVRLEQRRHSIEDIFRTEAMEDAGIPSPLAGEG